MPNDKLFIISRRKEGFCVIDVRAPDEKTALEMVNSDPILKKYGLIEKGEYWDVMDTSVGPPVEIHSLPRPKEPE